LKNSEKNTFKNDDEASDLNSIEPLDPEKNAILEDLKCENRPILYKSM